MKHVIAAALLVAASAAALEAQSKAPPRPAPAPVPPAPVAPQPDHTTHAGHKPPTDSAFAATQARGKQVMGVDQYTSTHVFEDLGDGGRIVLQRDVVDSAGEATIREHLQEVARRFTAGDFTFPGEVHATEVPGTKVMAERKSAIRYEFRPLPRGGEVRITTRDAAALRAVREFLAFQRLDHRAGGAPPDAG